METLHRVIKLRAALLAIVLGLPAFAGASEICYSTATSFANYVPPTNATLFNCPSAGSKTLLQLAALGWTLVRLAPQTVAGTDISDQLVLKRGVLIHRNGFEP